MKYAWIARNKAVWPITMTCEVLGVSASGYFEHQCVFRIIVTGRFGIVTADFGNVTGHFGSVTDEFFADA